MMHKFLIFLEDEPYSLIFIIAFGGAFLFFLGFIFNKILSGFGLQKASDFFAKLFGVPFVFTWAFGFLASMTFIISGVNVFKVLLMVVGVFFVCLVYSVLNFSQMKNIFEEIKYETNK